MSSEASFVTAREMRSSQESQISNASGALTAVPSRPRYRPPRPVPFELRQHCLIYFEEELYTQGLTLLANLLTSGTSSTTRAGDPVPAFVPTPQHLSLAATLVVHPRVTTRATSKEREQASILALRLLYNVNKLVGPVNAKFGTSFIFPRIQTKRKRGEGQRRSLADEVPGSDYDSDTVNTDIATTGSIWSRAEDFWHVVGWAFNCSVVCPKRWARWKLWLEFILDVLEDDWAERERLYEDMCHSAELGQKDNDDMEVDFLRESMIVQYLQGGREGAYGNKRRILRAIFANGGAKSMSEFKEVFKNEMKERKTDTKAQVKRPIKIDIEKDIFGDYADDNSDSSQDEYDKLDSTRGSIDMPPNTVNDLSTNPLRSTTNVVNGAEELGGMESLILRQRFLSLLSNICANTDQCFTSVADLYDLYAEHIRHLPLATFSLMISPSVLPGVILAYRLSFNQLLLHTLISTSAPRPVNDDLNQDVLEECYLPFPANTNGVVVNAKVSLLVESLLRLLAVHARLEVTQELQAALETGIRMREARAKDGRKKKGRQQTDDEGDWVWLQSSANRMRILLNSLKERG